MSSNIIEGRNFTIGGVVSNDRTHCPAIPTNRCALRREHRARDDVVYGLVWFALGAWRLILCGVSASGATVQALAIVPISNFMEQGKR